MDKFFTHFRENWSFSTISAISYTTLWSMIGLNGNQQFVIRDHQWARMEPHCLGLKSHPGRTGSDARLFMEAAFWIARTGSPWRDLPPGFGTGTRSAAAFEIERMWAFLSAYSMACPIIPTWKWQ